MHVYQRHVQAVAALGERACIGTDVERAYPQSLAAVIGSCEASAGFEWCDYVRFGASWLSADGLRDRICLRY
jgi:hypothetical protein